MIPIINHCVIYFSLLLKRVIMPQFIACPICKKNGIINIAGRTVECPCCGSVARCTWHIPDMISQTGWTTAEAVNAYYNKRIQEYVEAELPRHLDIFKANNPIASNSQIKERSKILAQILHRQAASKYPLLSKE